jgi:hypothetical protein
MKQFIFGLLGLFLFSNGAMAAPEGLYAYETSEGMMAGAVFGDFPADVVGDELVSATAPICEHVESHQMSEEAGIMKMRKIPSLVVEKNTVLSPQGYHLMLIKLEKPLREGQSFPLTLHFKKGGDKVISIPVLSRKSE